MIAARRTVVNTPNYFSSADTRCLRNRLSFSGVRLLLTAAEACVTACAGDCSTTVPVLKVMVGLSWVLEHTIFFRFFDFGIWGYSLVNYFARGVLLICSSDVLARKVSVNLSC